MDALVAVVVVARAVVVALPAIVEVSVVEVELAEPHPTATQYASAICMLLHEGAFTAGFHSMNVSTEIPYFSATR